MVTRKGTVLLMAKPFFPWMGNKEKLVPYIHQLIPPHLRSAAKEGPVGHL